MSSTTSPATFNLLIALLSLVVIIVVCLASLMVLRHVRRARQNAEQKLPLYNEKPSHKNQHSLTISTSRNSNIRIYQEKQRLMSDASAPDSPVPEIRITFPEEVDESGKRTSGRVVVVRVGEHSVGLEPLAEDLPPYQHDTTERFQSLDLERIGGLKEKI